MNANPSFEKLRAELAAAIKHARSVTGISQEQLALTAEVDRTYVSQIERQVANPSLQVLARLADTLDAEIKITFQLRERPALRHATDT